MSNQVPLSITARRPNLSNQIDIEDRWEPEEINDEFDLIEDIIDNQVSEAMLDTTSGQTVFGQKVFTNLFYSDGDVPSYESTMGDLQNDISPIVGTGAKAISTTETKKLGWSNENRSGIFAKLAGKNPILFKSNIYIEKTGNFIDIEAKNVPLAAYDVNKAGVPPASSGSNFNAYYWPTSVSFVGTIDLNDPDKIVGGLLNNARYEIYLAYRDDKGTTSCFIVRDGSEGNISNVYKSYRRIGFFRYKSGGNNDDFIITNGVFIPKHEWILPGSDFGNDNASLSGDTIGLIGYCKESCILEVSCDTPASDSTIIFNSNTLYGTYAAPNARYLKKYSTFRLPMIYINNQFLPSSINPATDIVRVKKVYFGGLY